MTTHTNHPNLDSIWRFVLYFIKKNPWIFLLQGLLCFAWSAKEALFPYFIKVAVDSAYYQHSQQQTAVLYPIFGLIAVWIIMEIAMRVQGALSAKAFPTLQTAIKKYLLNYLLEKNYQWLRSQPTGSLVDYINKTATAYQTLLEITLLNFTSIFAAILIMLILLFSVNAFFSGLLALWLVAHLLITVYLNPQILQSGQQHASKANTLTGQLTDSFNNIMAIKLFSRRHYENRYFKSLFDDESKKAQAAQMNIETMRMWQSAFASLYIIAMSLLLIYFWHGNRLSIGDLMLVPILSFSSLGMMWWLSLQINLLYREISEIKAALAFFKKAQIDKNAPMQAPAIKRGISINHLTFSHGDKTFFNDLDLFIPKGQLIGLIGLSGSGKSTFIHLLTKILSPESGSIALDDTNLQDISEASLSKQIAVVSQDNLLFNRSVYDNLVYGRLDASMDEIAEAARLATADEFINQLPDQYDTIVGNHGVNLSGGQKQRLCIARALLTQAPIMILDEPTSAIDAVTENILLNNLLPTFSNKTVIFISHRLSTLRFAKRLLYFSQGNVIADGRLDDLRENHPLVSEWVSSQTFASTHNQEVVYE